MTTSFEDAPNLEAEISEMAKSPPPLIAAAEKVAKTEKAEAREAIDAARARVALEARINNLVQCSLLDGWYKAKLAAGKQEGKPHDR